MVPHAIALRGDDLYRSRGRRRRREIHAYYCCESDVQRTSTGVAAKSKIHIDIVHQNQGIMKSDKANGMKKPRVSSHKKG